MSHGSYKWQRNENGNLVDFYKETRWSKKKNAFVTDATESTYVSSAETAVGIYVSFYTVVHALI